MPVLFCKKSYRILVKSVVYYSCFIGSGWGLVASAVFKTVYAAATVAGGFDSYTLPPIDKSRLPGFLPRKPFFLIARLYALLTCSTPSSSIKAFCNTLEKLTFFSNAIVSSQRGIDRVFFTAFVSCSFR